jgi:hypothetical protein
MRTRLLLIGLSVAVAATAAAAAEMPFGVLDIGLGASYARLERDLDFRDINESLAKKAGKPDLGKRGYGCMQRDDEYADVGCVSHTEHLDGIQTREIRLHFLDGRLQQFSVTAEVQNFDAVVGYLSTRFGAANGAGEKCRRPAERQVAERGRPNRRLSRQRSGVRDVRARVLSRRDQAQARGSAAAVRLAGWRA